MKVEGTLVWAQKGEPFQEPVVLSNEHRGQMGGQLVVLTPDGSPLASRPEELPSGSELLVSPQLSQEDFDEIQESGYTVRRSAFVMLGPDVPVSQFVRAMAETLPFVVVQGSGALNLIEELGGAEQTVKWLWALAEEVGHPVGINLPLGEGTRTALLAPSSWSQERLNGWMAGYKDELQEALGEFSRIQTRDQDVDTIHLSQSPNTDERKLAIAAAEKELSEVSQRLTTELQRTHPELFDAAGRLRPSRYSRAALKLTKGKRIFSREEILRLGQKMTGLEDETGSRDGA